MPRPDFNVFHPDVKNVFLASEKIKASEASRANVLAEGRRKGREEVRGIAKEATEQQRKHDKRREEKAVASANRLLMLSEAAEGNDPDVLEKMVAAFNRSLPNDEQFTAPEFVGPIMTFKQGRITFKGRAEDLKKTFQFQAKHSNIDPEQIINNPTLEGGTVSVPFKQMLLRAAVMNNVEISIDKPDKSLSRITEEKKALEAGTTPKTEFAAWSKQNPDPTPDELFAFAEELAKRKSTKGGEADLSDEQKRLRTGYLNATKRANSARLGVGIASDVTSPERDKVIQEELDRAETFKTDFLESGGDLSELGISPALPEGAPQFEVGDEKRNNTDGALTLTATDGTPFEVQPGGVIVWDGEKWLPKENQ